MIGPVRSDDAHTPNDHLRRLRRRVPLISYEPDEGWEPGDIVAFRCRDCLDRWDVELTADDIEP